MTEIKIDIAELKAEGDEVIKELADFLQEKTNANIETATNEIIIKTEEKEIPKQYVRVLLRKFLHKIELRDYFRVIGGKENTLIVKERKISEEE
ncbi:MAG: 60S ribosomal protein L22 [Candidatus Bathyarchaeales archaeon]